MAADGGRKSAPVMLSADVARLQTAMPATQPLAQAH